MPLGAFSIICFEFLSDFWRKLQKKKKKKKETGKFGMFGFLRRNEEHPRRNVALCRRVGLPHRGKAEGPKRPPLGYARV